MPKLLRWKQQIHGITPLGSPRRVFFLLLAIVFLCEAAVMWLLHFLNLPEGPLEGLTDAGILTLLITPFVWSLIVRPLRNLAIAENVRAEDVIANALDGIITIDEAAQIQSFNPAAEQMFGYSADEVIGQNFAKLIPAPFDRQHENYIKNNANRAEKQILCYGREVEGLRKDGTAFPIEITVSQVNYSGRPMFTSILRDITERKQAREALRKERDFVSAIVDTVGALVVVLDHDGRIVRFNRTCERITGYAFDEVQGKFVWDFLLIPEEIEPVKGVFAELQAGRFPNQFKNYWLTKNGEKRLIAWSNTALTNNKGTAEYVIGTGIDITEAERAQQELRESEAKYRAIFENAVMGIFKTNLAGQYIIANPTLARTYGYESPEELMRAVKDLNRQFYVQPDRRKEFMRLMEEHDVVEGFESRVYCKNGSVIWISENARAIRDSRGKLLGFEGTTVDITDRRRAEEALRESELRFRSLVESAKDAIVLADCSGEIISWNKSAQAIFGYRESEVVGKPLTTIMPERYREAHRKGLTRFCETGKSEVIGRTVELAGLKKNGSEFPLELSLAAWT